MRVGERRTIFVAIAPLGKHRKKSTEARFDKSARFTLGELSVSLSMPDEEAFDDIEIYKE